MPGLSKYIREMKENVTKATIFKVEKGIKGGIVWWDCRRPYEWVIRVFKLAARNIPSADSTESQPNLLVLIRTKSCQPLQNLLCKIPSISFHISWAVVCERVSIKQSKNKSHGYLQTGWYLNICFPFSFQKVTKILWWELVKIEHS